MPSKGNIMKCKLFIGDGYYPNGGYKDFIGNFDSIKEARQYTENIKDTYDRWAHMVIDDEIILSGIYETSNGREWQWKKE